VWSSDAALEALFPDASEAAPSPSEEASAPAPAPASESPRSPLDTVQAVIGNWGAGAYLAEGTGDAAIAADFAAEGTTDATGGYEWKHTDAYKVYHGTEGAKEWLVFLTTLDFPDFEVVSMAPGAVDGTVEVSVAYTPYVKTTMKQAPEKFTDNQVWTVTDGKVSHVVFTWGKPEMLDAMFGMSANEKVIAGCVGAWGTGQFAGEDGRAVAEGFCTPEVTIDANPSGFEYRNATGYKQYEGIDGWMAWLDFLLQLDFPDFKVTNLHDGTEAGTVTMCMSATAKHKTTGKALEAPSKDEATFTVTDGKISACTFVWSSDAALEALFPDASEAAPDASEA
jgi:hypothetical protein